MGTAKRTAVLVHGCHLQADLNGKSWEDIVWGGDVPTLEGRGTMAAKIALECEAELIIFSTGASERDGLKEGAYTYEYVRQHTGAVADAIGVSGNRLAAFMLDRAETDLESQNTREECARNFTICVARGIERVILVSSPWHIQRCHTEALKVADEMRRAGKDVPELVAMASHGGTEGVVVLEPPHRGDRPKTRFHEVVPRFFRVPAHQQERFLGGVEALLSGQGA
ncbi:MAG TPA: ElyC/SanA/YdcF family protein [Candidatus Paceibacterota bacterium]|nr:ElyC/SanA/YdcF family protein [Candidatus Paceibacterota bacterium]